MKFNLHDKPTAEQKQFFTAHNLVLPTNALTAKYIMDYINEDGDERTTQHLQLLRLLHATAIGLTLDNGDTITYVRVKSMRERMNESLLQRKCPFKAYVRTERGNWHRCLSICTKNGMSLWHPSVPVEDSVDWKRYKSFTDDAVEKVRNHLRIMTTKQSLWRFCEFERLGGSCTVQFMGRTPSDFELETLGEELKKIQLPDGASIYMVDVGPNGFVYYRIRVDPSLFQKK